MTIGEGAGEGSEEMTGVLVAESLRTGTDLDGPPLVVTQVRRLEVDDEEPVWTLLTFSVAPEHAPELAGLLQRSLRVEGGWYADFGNAAQHWVVFAGKSFHYTPGDTEARAGIDAYARSLGVPEGQLDWRDAAQ